ncbi:beta-ketoacyl reductase, partial [Jidongwangia harbinensis]|uniref:beta-ketoacyl reductase n=1 Tax=Jidongwangia harbinensis TaxID=2878561 RepID=UPI001CD9CB90
WTPRGTVLITGGTGGLGVAVARWAAGQGAEHLVLTSRRGLDAPGAAELVEELTAAGVRVTIVAGDMGERADVAAALAEAGDDLTAVVHTAGVPFSTAVEDLDVSLLASTLAGKSAGARYLDELLGDRPLDAFVLFSSIVGVWGSAGGGAYGAANAYLDGLAQHRHGRGLAATSIGWGPWAEVGMAHQHEDPARLARHGLGLLPPESATPLMGLLPATGHPTEIAVDVRWEQFGAAYWSSRSWPLLSSIPEAAPRSEAGSDTTTTVGLLDQLAGRTEADRDHLLLEVVTTQVAAVLGHAGVEEITPDRAFRDLGFDSLTAVELRNRLGRITGLKLPATLAFDYPTPTALVGYLREQLVGTVVTSAAGLPGVAVGTDEPIAIVSMACRYPGGVRSPEDLWELLADGRDVVGGFPTDRGWDLG